MPHRDPETGQYVAGDGADHGISYSDHDVHHIKHEFRAYAPTGNGNPDEFRDTRRFEITERGLDPDEIAELRLMRIHIGTEHQYDGTDEGPSLTQYQVDAGYNLADGEFLESEFEALGQDGLDPDGDDLPEYEVEYGDTDEVGQLYTESGTVFGVVMDETDGAGAGPSYRGQTVTLDMAEMFGSGPFVDSADDFVTSIFLNPERINNVLGINVSYSLYYNVMKTEGGRSRFGR